eukprot:5350767-Prorocentrum_lima.AAC.1
MSRGAMSSRHVTSRGADMFMRHYSQSLHEETDQASLQRKWRGAPKPKPLRTVGWQRWKGASEE